MSKIGPIEAALQEALKTEQGKKEKRPAYLKRLQEGAQELPQEKWDELPTSAQEWVNDATKASNDDKPLPDFPDEEPATKDDAKAEAKPSSKENEPVSSKKGGAKKPASKPAKGEEKKPAAKKDAAKKAAADKKGGGRGVKGEGYKGHRVGSNKETVHKVFDEKGADAAVKKAVALGIKEGSAKSWISSWGGKKK